MEEVKENIVDPTLVVMDTVAETLTGEVTSSDTFGNFLIRVSIAVAIALVVTFVICRRVLPWLSRKSRQLNHPIPAILFEGLESPLSAFILSGVAYFIFMASPYELSAWVTGLIAQLYSALLIFYVSWFGWNCTPLCGELLNRFSPTSTSESTIKTATGFLANIWRIIVSMLAVISLLEFLGFNVSSLIAGLGLAGLTVSLAAQSSADNFVCGLILVLEQTISVGDWVVIGDVEGQVEAVTLRSTKLRKLDRSLAIIANSAVCDGTIQNLSRRPSRIYDFLLGVTYDTPRPTIEKLMADIEAMLNADPLVDKGTVMVKLWGFGSSSIDILVRCHVNTPLLNDFILAQNTYNLRLMDIMEKNHCSFAFPSTSIYMETPLKVNRQE